MPDPAKTTPQGGDNAPAPEVKDQPQAPVADIFGETANAPEAKAPAAGEGDGKKDDGKKFEPIPEDHPTIVALKNEIQQVKDSHGGNLSKQREIIKGLEDKIATLTKGGAAPAATDDGKDDPNLPFPDVKFSKDLTKEEREEMTDNEIRLMDQLAATQDYQNKQYLASKKQAAEQTETQTVNVNTTVQNTAKELSKGEDGKENLDLANEIIESVKQFNLEGLSEAEIKDRVNKAAQLLPSYTPPKEQIKKPGNPVKENPTNSDDPFGVDQIVEEVANRKGGSYDL